MKIIIGVIVAVVILMFLGLTTIFSIGIFLSGNALAQDYTPLDFLDQYDKFEVRIGVDAVNGRYATYHYEFKD